jgi:hypothetical protein
LVRLSVKLVDVVPQPRCSELIVTKFGNKGPFPAHTLTAIRKKLDTKGFLLG